MLIYCLQSWLVIDPAMGEGYDSSIKPAGLSKTENSRHTGREWIVPWSETNLW